MKLTRVVQADKRTKISISLNNFFFSAEDWKTIFLISKKQDVNWLSLIRELLKREFIKEQKKYSALAKERKEETYKAFDDFVTNVVPRRHYKEEFLDEKIKVYKLFQVLSQKLYGGPVAPTLAWVERDKIGFKTEDIKIFEDVLHQLIEEGRFVEYVYEWNDSKYYKYKPVVALISKKFSKRHDNPFVDSDVETARKAAKNVKDGTAVSQSIVHDRRKKFSK